MAHVEDDAHDEPGSRYAAAVGLLGDGDEQGARRALQCGLARAGGAGNAVLRACLTDLAAQLDGEAALARFARRTPGPAAWMAHPHALAVSVLALDRAHLVEAVVEEVAHVLDERRMLSLVHRVAGARTPECHDLLVAVGAVAEGAVGWVARDLAAGVPASSAAVEALRWQAPVAAWTAGPAATRGQRQVIIAVARDAGRVSPVVALLAGGRQLVLDDAFVLPDMIPARLHREVLAPMARAGLQPVPTAVPDAATAVWTALAATLDQGRDVPSSAYQPVAARLRRALIDDITR